MNIQAVSPAKVVNGIPRYGDATNYSETFGFQWNRFAETQLHPQSSEMLWRLTGWTPEEIDGLNILEVGSGAGRLSRVLLEETRANLYSLDYSSAVDANWRNNGHIAPQRFHLYQASIYEMPFPDDTFDKVLCRGVLQHTPDFEQSVKALVDKAKPGGEIVVDFYEIRGWWTKINAKYLLRPIAKRLKDEQLLSLIERNVDWLVRAHNRLAGMGLHSLTRFLPLVDVSNVLPKDLSPKQLREWAILDTFDMFSPEYDNPQRTGTVVAMFERAGAQPSYVAPGVVRAIKSH